uniref:Bbp19-like phage domain-containing protein n=1 Tax=viral metagenome TaxID=1070528 RepID=A0A6M3LI88_9ZZZZ
MDNYNIDVEIKKKIADKQQVYQRVFNTDDGKAVLKDLESRAFIKVTTYDSDIKKMCINEGRRSLYAYIVNFLNKDLQSILEEITGKE